MYVCDLYLKSIITIQNLHLETNSQLLASQCKFYVLVIDVKYKFDAFTLIMFVLSLALQCILTHMHMCKYTDVYIHILRMIKTTLLC